MKKLFFTLIVLTTPLCTIAQEQPRIIFDETMRPPVMLAFKALFAPEYAGYTRMLIAAAETVLIERDKRFRDSGIFVCPDLQHIAAARVLEETKEHLSSQEPHDEMMAFVHQWVRDCTQDFKAQIAEIGEEIFFLIDGAYKALKTLQDPSITPFAVMKIHGASRLGKMAWDTIINHSR